MMAKVSKPTLRTAVLACLVFLLSTGSVLAGVTVHLNDGGTIRGEIESESDTTVTISNEFGSLEIERSNIKRIDEGASKRPSYNASFYSFKKQSWSKYAMFATLGVGFMSTALTADATSAAVPTYIAIGFGSAFLTFAALDYFIYGRVPKRRQGFGFNQAAPALYMTAALAPADRPQQRGSAAVIEPRANLAWASRF